MTAAVEQLPRKRVLIADDDESIRKLVAKVLSRAGFETTQAADGQEAIEWLAREQFDAVVLDIMMPRLDGFGVISRLVSQASTIVRKIVVVTAFSKVATSKRLDGICLVIAKPFEVEELLSAVKECIDR